MLNKPSMLLIGILAISLLASMQPHVTAPPPRHCKGLDIYFYETPDLAFAALLACEIDFMDWPLTSEQYQTACTTPDLQLARYGENGIFEFDFNNNYTIADFPGVRSPMNDVNFRRALACMVDKDYLVNEECDGFACRIDVPIPCTQSGWWNESCTGNAYPYEDCEAETYLIAGGFVDSDKDGTRNYPVGWPGREDGPNLDPIKFCIRSDHGHRLMAGRALADNMRNYNISVNQIEASGDVLFPIVMDDRNYHIYTGSWSVGRYPPIYMYYMFHSKHWCSGGSNYVTGMNASNQPNYSDLDEELEKAYYATNLDDAIKHCKNAQCLLVTKYCVSVWLWSYMSYWAYRKVLVGVVNKNGYGPQSEKNFLTAYKCDDPATPEDESQDPLKLGTVHAPKDLNILYSSWPYDYAVLDRFFSHLLQVNPYNLAIDQPWIAQDWEVTTWYDAHDDEDKTKVTYWIRKDVWWHAPVTGEAVYQFTAEDVEFTIWYIFAHPDCWQWPRFMDVHHTLVVDDFCIEVYFDSISLWHQYNPTGPLLPQLIYEPLLCTEKFVEVHIEEAIEPSDYMMFTADYVLKIKAIIKDGVIPLVEGVDYEVVVLGGGHGCIHWLRHLDICQVLNFTYTTPTVDPHGYYLANLDWSLTFYTLGTHYPIEIVPGVGGRAIMNCNPTHFLGGSPNGEMDWMWYWSGITKPRSGYYQVNLYDAVYLLSAYCSRGDGVPDGNWFPGADIDCYDLCHVGLYDAVLLLSHYGEKFGIPPDP